MTNKIVALRKQNKVTQEELAKAAGISRQALYAIEKSKNIPTVETAMKIAMFFGKSIEEIFSLDEGWTVVGDADAEGELVFGQGLDKYAGIKYGKFPFSFNGGEIAAAYNAMLLSGRAANLEDTVEEFEINGMPVLFGAAGTDPKRLGEYFDGHGVAYEKAADKDEFADKLADGKIFVVSYREISVKRLVHTVCGVVRGENVELYNVSNEDTEPTVVDKAAFVSKKSIVCAYVI